MTVTGAGSRGSQLDISEELRHRMPASAIPEGPAKIIGEEPALSLLLMGGALCNDASLEPESGRPGYFRLSATRPRAPGDRSGPLRY